MKLFVRDHPDYEKRPLTIFDKPISKTSKIAKQLDNVIQGIFSVVEEEEIKFEPRSSSLPFCPVLSLTEAMQGKVKVLDYAFRYYTGVGTAIHESLQRAFPVSRHGAKAFGNWVCEGIKDPNNSCSYVKEHSIRPKSLNCPKCARNLEYGELSLRFEHKKDKSAFISGHCDLVTKHGKDIFVVWEFKSSSDFNIKNPHVYLPYPKHLFQKWAYAAMLTRMGMRPKYLALCYFSRNTAGRDKFTPEGVTLQGVKTEMITFYYKVTDEALELMDKLLDETVEGVRLANKIQAQLDKAKKPSPSLIRKLTDNRPCKDYKDYDTYMQYHFHSSERCPYAKVAREGGCYTKKFKVDVWKDLTKAVYKRYEAKRLKAKERA